MDTEKKENIIKDLLYEVAARDHLKTLDKRKYIKRYIICFSVAAALVILIIINYNNGDSSLTNRHDLVLEEYSFPPISKSRSDAINIIDDYIEELNSNKYDVVLSKLRKKPLSIKDNYYKAHIYFVLDSLSQSLLIIENSEWSDPHFNNELSYLKFLIKFKNGKDKQSLIDLSNKLSTEYQIKAANLIDRL